MAQIVNPYKIVEEYTEGPFVVVPTVNNGWRIECESLGYYAPTLADNSIYQAYGKLSGNLKNTIIELCDTLNQRVQDGEIVREGKTWVLVQ